MTRVNDPARCPVCDWPLAADRRNGCVPGDCCYRPDDPAEQRRLAERRAKLAGVAVGDDDGQPE